VLPQVADVGARLKPYYHVMTCNVTTDMTLKLVF
jgi:hypothetical protein